MRMRLSAKFFLLAFLLISAFLVLVWFRKGMLLGTSESGLPFYNLSRFCYPFVWIMWVLGKYSTPFSLLFFSSFNTLSSLGVPVFLLQAFFFWLILLISSLSVHFLVLKTFGKERRLLSVVAGLFYILNPITIVSVWSRMQYPYMFFYALMPTALFFLIEGLNKKKFTYALYLNLASVFFTTTFASFALLELFWIILGSYFLFYILTNWQDKKSVIFAFRFFFLTLFLWLLLNLWWFLQFVDTLFATPFETAEAVTQKGNIGTFTAASKMTGFFHYLFRLQDKWFLERRDWGAIYFSPLFLFLGFLTPVFTFSSLLIKKKPKLYWYFALLSILGLFFAKGSAPPLGQIFLFAFSHSRPLEAFRNPFEKIGFVLPLAFAPLLALGLSSFYSWLKKLNYKLAILSLFTFCFLIFGLYSFPMWDGRVFVGSEPPTNDPNVGYAVKVPDYYKEARERLNQDKSDFRAIALPVNGEGITYNWEYGYAGIELSNLLFDTPFISLNTAFQYLGEIVSPLEDFFLKNTERFYKLMGTLNSKYLMVRSDIDYEGRNMRSPEVMKGVLRKGKIEIGNKEEMGNGKGLEFVEKFGELEFWKVSEEMFVPHFYTAGTVSFVDKNLQNPYAPLSFDDFELRGAIFSFGEEIGLPLELADNFYISGQPHPRGEIRVTELGAGKFLPGSKLYLFVRWKERRAEKEVSATNDLDKIIDFHLGLASKRLGEVEKLMERVSKLEQSRGQSEIGERGNEGKREEDEGLIEESWKRFWERLNKAYQLLREMENQEGDVTETAVRVLAYTRLFQGKFSYFLSGEGLQVDISDELKKLLVLRYQLEQKAWVTHNELEKRYFIEVPKTGSYEFFVKELADAESISLGEGMDKTDGYRRLFEEDPFEPMSFALNDNLATASGQKRKDKWLSFGNYHLEEGRQKLQIFLPRFVNLAKQEDLTLSAEKGQSLVLPLDNFLEQGRSFNISFTYRIKGENNPRLIVAQKLEIEGKDEVRKVINRVVDTVLPKSEHELQFIKSFTIHPGTKEAGITIFFEEYGNSEIEIGNFQVTRDWRPIVVFRATTNSSEFKEAAKITFQRVNPTRYEVEVKEAEAPYLLVFSESFHPGWGLYLDRTDGEGDADGKILASYFDKEIKERLPRNDFAYKGMFDTWGRKEAVPKERHLLANGYANSWYIKPEDVDGKSSYRFIVEFQPQRLFYLGLFVSGMTFLGSFGYLGYKWLGKKKKGNGK